MSNIVEPPPEKKAAPTARTTGHYQVKPWRFLIGFFLIGIAAIIIYFALPDEIIKNPDGTYSLSPERLAKKEEEKRKIDNHEVYRLTAVKDGTYICWDCPDGTIYLRAGMIWRYGITSNSQRHSKAQLLRWGVKYTPFYWGDLAECRKVEKDYIYGYPELPEYPMVVQLNSIYLIRPPGNKEDN